MAKAVKGLVAVAALAAAGVGYWCWHCDGDFSRMGREAAAFWEGLTGTGPDRGVLKLYGNIDQRQISLAFLESGRIEAVDVIEGDRVKAGQPVARLETRRLQDSLAIAKAQKAQADATLLELKNGTRPEEIEQARAALASAQAELAYAELVDRRNATLVRARSISQQEKDASVRALAVAQANVRNAEKALELARIGPRAERIEQAAAQVRTAAATVAQLETRLEDCQLKSPAEAIVTRRILEAGDMASPSTPVYSLAVSSPKWVRAWASETDLVRIKPGQPASVSVDSLARPIPARVGFVGQTAEFTPKTVQTEDLRTSLVYEVRVVVDDPDNVLRLGMPATVRLENADHGRQ